MIIDRETRVNLVDALAPPPNGVLQSGVLLTYSAETSVVITVLLALSGVLNASEEHEEAPAGKLQAILKLADKVRIITHAGRFDIPQRFDRITALLDSIIFQVQDSDPQGNPRSDCSFHPKLILLKYAIEDSQPEFRLVVTSRNLTSDRSMDVIALTSLRKSVATTEAGTKLSTFIEAALSKRPPKRQLPATIIDLLSEVKTLDIRPFGDEADYLYPKSFDFHFQIGGQTDSSAGLTKLNSILEAPQGSRTIFSPFVDLSTLKTLFPRPFEHSGAYNLLSRHEELDKICSTEEGVAFLQSIQCWVPKVIDVSVQAYGGVHAKFIVDSNAHKTQVFLGSANATRRAWEGNNWECLLSLQTDQDLLKHLHIDWFGIGLDGQSKVQPLAERYYPSIIKKKEKDDLSEIWHNAISCAKLTSIVSLLGKNVRTIVTLKFDGIPNEPATFDLKLRPISLEHDYFPANLSDGHAFLCQYDTSIRTFTCFIEVNVYSRTDLVCSVVRLLEDVSDELLKLRDDYAVRDEVERQGLFRYLNGILGDAWFGGPGGGGGAPGDGKSLMGNIPEFVSLESLYTACLRDTTKAKEVDRVLMSAPDEFTDTDAGWKVRKALIPLQTIWREIRSEIFQPSS